MTSSGSFIAIKITILSGQGILESRVIVPELCAQSPISTFVTIRCGGDELVELSTVNVKPQEEQCVEGS